VIEPRVYRAAFVPALLAIVLAMFSFESRPGALEQGLPADVLFDGAQAADLATRIANDNPDRRAGTSGDLATADRVAGAFAARGFSGGRGGQPQIQRFTHAGHDLVNVIGLRAGRSRRAIVIVAARDADSIPDAPGSAADTAALMQLARVYQGRPSQKTLLLASVDGSNLGEVGATELVAELPPPDSVDAVLVMSDLGAHSSSGSLLQAWSNDSRRAGIGLQRTVADSIRQEVGGSAGGSGAFGQVARMSFPIGIGAQGVLLEKGYDAVRISGSGELPPDGDGPVEAIDEDRLGMLGRATLRTLSAVDQGPRPQHGPESYVQAVSQLLPGWVISLLAGALLLPVLVASVDAFARARRRQVDVLRWLRWVAAWVAPFLAALALAQFLALVGATPAPPPAPVAPRVLPLDGAALGVLAGVAAAMVLALFLARWLAVRPDAELRDPVEPGAGVALALAIAAGSLLLWLVNPFAGLLAVPAAHLWMLTVVTRPAPPRRLRAVMIGLGVAPAALVAIYYMFALNLDPLHGAWYLLMLVTGHSVGIVLALIGCLMLAAACGTAEIAWRLPDEDEVEPGPQGPAVYGPGSYAGPGSLGGTQSALRR
jgi:MFS family permease